MKQPKCQCECSWTMSGLSHSGLTLKFQCFSLRVRKAGLVCERIFWRSIQSSPALDRVPKKFPLFWSIHYAYGSYGLSGEMSICIDGTETHFFPNRKICSLPTGTKRSKLPEIEIVHAKRQLFAQDYLFEQTVKYCKEFKRESLLWSGCVW